MDKAGEGGEFVRPTPNAIAPRSTAVQPHTTRSTRPDPTQSERDGEPMAMTKTRWRMERRRIEETNRWLRARPLAMDGLLALAVGLLFSVWSLYSIIDATRPPNDLAIWAAVVLALSVVGQPIALVFRRAAPTWSFVVVSALSLIQAALPGAPRALPSLTIFLFSLYAYCAYGKRAAAVAGIAVGAVGAAVVTAQVALNSPSTNGQVPVIELFGTFFGVALAAWSLALVRRAQMVYVSTLEERAARAEAERAEEARRAVLDERARIAREMHDVIAHSLAVIVSQAQGGQYAARSDPARAVEVLETIARAGREALADTRGLLDVLRPDAPSTTTQSWDPQPTLRELPEMLDRVRSTGLSVKYSEHGRRFPLGPSAELVLYRMVQEALTNTLKHAGTRRRGHGPLRLVRGRADAHGERHGARSVTERRSWTRVDRDARAPRLHRRVGRGGSGTSRRLHRTCLGAASRERRWSVRMSIRVFLVDDQAMVRAGFAMVISAQKDMQVVGEASDGAEALALLAGTPADVVVMDIRMPRMDGVEATRQLLARPGTPPKIIVLTTFDLDEYAFAALRAGASGFLLKDAPPEDLLAAIRTVQQGDAVIAPSTTRRLLDQVATSLPAPDDDDDPLAELTDRERDVLCEVARGSSNAEIAERLFLAEGTVKTHVGRILSKLGLRDRVQAVVWAYEHHLVRPGD